VIDGFRTEAPMNRDHFRLTEAQLSKIEPHLPTDTRGDALVQGSDRPSRKSQRVGLSQ
jgi:hypothetical protein